MNSSKVDIVVIGGGVVGLSIAYHAARTGRSVILLEKHARFGEETSTRNSMVLHAGIYYPPGSLKARLCVEGRCELVTRCRSWKVPHAICCKMIVASDSAEMDRLEDLEKRARKNGAGEVRVIDGKDLLRKEPGVTGVAALWSPLSGVLDVAVYLQILAAKAQAAGAHLLTSTSVVAMESSTNGITIVTDIRGKVLTEAVVNAAGLYADDVAAMAGNLLYKIYPCRGEYAVVTPGRAGIVRGLVYPVPKSKKSHGVHLTKTIHGELWIGPTARYIESKTDYESNRFPLSYFYERAINMVPDLQMEDLRPGFSGIRPKRVPDGEPSADFLIEKDESVPGLIHLIGMESPGLTASPAIARHVCEMLDG